MTQVRKTSTTLPMARLGAPSRLPRFRWQQPIRNMPTPPNFGLTEEESRHGFTWGEDSILPYQVSDDYDRELRPSELDCIVIENERLRALIAPSLGGRLLELKDLVANRDLVFRNPVFQPANLGSLNAWFSGGIEWNGLIPGHTPFTCASVFAGMRNTERGPLVRIYEFDRIVEATWQIDLFLPHDAACLYTHGRIVNPSDHERLAYWWTNIAAPMSDGTRVLSPADYSVEHIWPGNNLGRCEFPRKDWDASYPDNWKNATSVFFRAPSADRLFIASIDRSGYGLVQTSTSEMHGRKFFYFGSAAGGQNWMDYLSRPGEGKYLEIQSGIAPTQNQRFPLAAGQEMEWTEAYAPLQLDPRSAHDTDYAEAVTHARIGLDAVVPAGRVAEIGAFLREQARLPLDERYSSGTPWGVRHEQLLGRPLADGLDFAIDVPGDCWDDLASGHAIAGDNLHDVPDSVVVSPSWVDCVAASAEANGATWLHELILAIARLDEGDTEAALAHADASLDRKPNWLGYRLKALIAADVDSVSENYLKAWSLGDAPPELAVEIATHLMDAGHSDELKRFVDGLPAKVRSNERIVLAQAMVAANDREFDESERLLMSRQFATIREGETLLSDLWVKLRRGRLEADLGRVVTAEELQRDLASHPLPSALDLRMHQVDDVAGD